MACIVWACRATGSRPPAARWGVSACGLPACLEWRPASSHSHSGLWVAIGAVSKLHSSGSSAHERQQQQRTSCTFLALPPHPGHIPVPPGSSTCRHDHQAAAAHSAMASPPPRPVVLVTGCSAGGIGYELCLAFAARGCRVFASARKLESMAGLKDAGIQLLSLDVTDAAAAAAAVEAVVTDAGRIDLLVNNAGVVVLGPTAEVPLHVVRQAFDVNVLALLSLCQAVVPHMARQGTGKILNIGSLTGFTPVALRGIYSSTKAAVMRLSDALRIELRPLGVQVMLVAPGFIASNARATAREAACSYVSNSLWGNWLDVLEAAMAKLLVGAVPADAYARHLVDVALRLRMPRYWVGPCAGKEWLLRWLPLWLQDKLCYKAMGLAQLEPQLLANAAGRAVKKEQ